MLWCSWHESGYGIMNKNTIKYLPKVDRSHVTLNVSTFWIYWLAYLKHLRWDVCQCHLEMLFHVKSIITSSTTKFKACFCIIFILLSIALVFKYILMYTILHIVNCLVFQVYVNVYNPVYCIRRNAVFALFLYFCQLLCFSSTY